MLSPYEGASLSSLKPIFLSKHFYIRAHTIHSLDGSSKEVSIISYIEPGRRPEYTLRHLSPGTTFNVTLTTNSYVRSYSRQLTFDRFDQLTAMQPYPDSGNGVGVLTRKRKFSIFASIHQLHFLNQGQGSVFMLGSFPEKFSRGCPPPYIVSSDRSDFSLFHTIRAVFITF